MNMSNKWLKLAGFKLDRVIAVSRERCLSPVHWQTTSLIQTDVMAMIFATYSLH